MSCLNSVFSELISSGIEDFEDKLFDFICDSKKRVSIDKFKAVSEQSFNDQEPRHDSI